MKMKKVTGLLFATVLACAMVLGGCGNTDGKGNDKKENAGDNKETGNEEGGTKAEGADKIILFQSKVEIIDQLEALAEDYKEETGVEVEVWGTTGDDYFQQLKTKLANNMGPTVFSLAPGAESLQMKSYLADLSELSFVNKIQDGMENEIDGKVVGIPYTAEGIGLVYNSDLYNPKEITDTDALIQFMKEQKEAGVNGLGLSSESYFLIGHILNTPFALQKDPADYVANLAAGKVKMADTKEFQEFAKLYAGIRENTPNPLEQDYDKETGDFATGKSAVIHQGNWSAGMFADYDMDFEMSLAPLPLVGNDKLAVSVPTAWYVNSQASEAEQQAGRDFLEWLYTSEKGMDYLMNQFGFIPVLEGMENENMDPLSKAVSSYIAEGNIISWPMNDWPAGMVDVYLVPIAQEFFTTDMTPEAFLEKLDAAWAEATNK